MAGPLSDFRQKYPQYDAYSDQQLADALYDKYYAGKVEKADYLNQLGLSSGKTAAAAESSAPLNAVAEAVAPAKPQAAPQLAAQEPVYKEAASAPPPLKEEIRTALDAKYNALPQTKRDQIALRRDPEGKQDLESMYFTYLNNKWRDIDRQTEEATKPMGAYGNVVADMADPRREGRARMARMQGAAPQVAENIAAQDAAYNMPLQPIPTVEKPKFSDLIIPPENLEAPKDTLSQARNALARGVYETASYAPTLMSMIAQEAGAEETALGFLQDALRLSGAARGFPAAVPSFVDVKSFSDMPTYALEGFLENSPQLIGSALAAIVGGSVAKKLALNELGEIATSLAAKELAKRQALGAAAGAGAASIGMESASIYQDIAEKTGQMRPGTAVAFGTLAGILDVLPAMKIAENILGPKVGDFVAKEIIKRYGKEAGKTFLLEGGTEWLQKWIEKAAVATVDGKPFLTKENLIESIDALLKGGFAGAGVGVTTKAIGELSDKEGRARAKVTDAAEKARQDALKKWEEQGFMRPKPAEQTQRQEPFVGEPPPAPPAPPTAPPAPPPAGPTEPTTIEDLLETAGPTRTNVLDEGEVDYTDVNRKLLEEGSITQEQFDEAERDRATKEAEQEDEDINRRLREASLDEEEEAGGLPEPKLTRRGKKMVTQLEAAKYDLVNAKRNLTNYESRVKGAVAETGMSMGQLPDTTQTVLNDLKKKVEEAQAKYDSLLEDEKSSASFVEPNMTVEQLKAEQDSLRTKAGKPPMPKSVARARFDALQQQINKLQQEQQPPAATEPPAQEEPPPPPGATPKPEKKPPIPNTPYSGSDEIENTLLPAITNMVNQVTNDFMVGDYVRLAEHTPGVVVGISGDYLRVRPLSATNPKAYVRVPKKNVTFESRPDTTSTSSASKTPDQENKFGKEEGQLGINMPNTIQLMGQNMYGASLADVAIKEMLQNAFDAVKGAVSDRNAPSLYKVGHITITIDGDTRTITVEDDGRGMTPDIIRNAFFTIAGSDKSDLPPELRSGGFGLAKMGFILGSERLRLDTVRDGVRVTVDATAQEIANSQFTINKAPAKKGEHGTKVSVVIPETYTDQKNGDLKTIYFPYGVDYIDPLNKPLIGPVEVKVAYKSGDYDVEKTLPVGVNFPSDKFQKFKVKFAWGTAEIYFGVDRTDDPTHQVLSSGVYQFNGRGGYKHLFPLSQSESIPYDIIVNVFPSVGAKDIDYPFENNREAFKRRIDEDIESLITYLAKIARGNEAADLKESFENVVSMPRAEIGESAADDEKIKRAFDRRVQEVGKGAKFELPPMPEEVVVSDGVIQDTSGRVLVDRKAERQKEEEKKAGKSFEAEQEIDMDEHKLELSQDPKLPIFHNNTNVNFLEVGEPYGNPQAFFSELGSIFAEMKEEIANSNMYGYDLLKPENLFFVGIGIDKKYGGLHIRLPYKAVLINPFYDWGAKTLFGVRQNILNTMIHEIAHTADMSHGVGHNGQMIRVEQYLADTGMLDYFRDAILEVLLKHESTFTAMREAYGKSTTVNTAKSLEDYERKSSAASARGTGTSGQNQTGAVPTGGQPTSGGAVPPSPPVSKGKPAGKSGRPAKAPVTYKHMNKLLNNLKQTPGNALKAVNNLIQIMSDRPEIKFWSTILPLLPDWAVRSRLPRQLVKDGDKYELKSILPQLDAYDRALAAFEQVQKQLEGEIKRILDLGRKLPSKTHAALSVLQLEATTREIDPDINNKDPYLNQLWAQLQSMPDGQKAIEVYREQRDFYKKMYNKIRSIAARNIYMALVRKGNTPSEAAAKTKEILDRDMPQRKGPYFPMSRFGDHWIGFKMTNEAGKLEKGFLMFESGMARDNALKEIEAVIREEVRQELAANDPNAVISEKDITDAIVNGERLQARDGFSTLLNFVYGQENALSKARDIIGESFEEMIEGLQKSGNSTLTTAEAEKLLRQAKNDAAGTIQQLLVQLAPAGSLKKLFAKRKKIMGAVADSNRSFAVTATKQMNYLARVMHGGDMEAALIAANEGLKYLNPRNQIYAGMIVSEFERRMESNLHPTSQPSYIQLLSGTAFAWQLTSIASALRNVMYMGWNGIAVLGSRLGVARTSALMTKYITGFSRGFYAKDRPDGIMGFGFPSLLYSKGLNKFVREGLERAVAENKLNISQAYDLAEIRRTPSGISPYSWRGVKDSPRRVLNLLATVLHNSERMGREVLWATALEGRARELFKEKKADGTNRYTPQQIADLAYEFANEYAGERSAGTFGYQRRGRVFKMPVPNLILKYMSPLFQTTYLQFEALNTIAWHRQRRWIREERQRVMDDPQLGPDAVKELDKLITKESYAAMRYLVFLNAVAFIFMGMEGTPFWWLLSRIAGYFLRQNDPNKDNPEAVDFDLDLFLENYMAEQTNPEIAQMLMRGPVSNVLNVSLVDQMSMNPPSMFLQGWSGTATKNATDVVQKVQDFLLGAVLGGLPKQAARAVDAGEHDTMRGVETALPAGIRTFVAALRVNKEGFTTLKGEEVLPARKVTGWDLALTAMGFSPEDYRRHQVMKFKLETAANKIEMERFNIYDDFYFASKMEPGERKNEAIAKVMKSKDNFNIKYPSKQIENKDMQNSLTSRNKRAQQAKAHLGLSVDEKMWPIISDRTKFGRMNR
jgi:hypothetical protein